MVREAKKTGSIAGVVRRLIDERMRQPARTDDPAFVLVRGASIGDPDLEAAAELTAGYGKGRDEALIDVRCRLVDTGSETVISVSPHESTILKEAVNG